MDLNNILNRVNKNPHLLEMFLYDDVKFRPMQKNLIINSLSTPNKNALITVDMGVGKTYISLGIAQLLRLAHPDKKICFVALKNKLNEYAQVLSKHLGTSVLLVTGEQPMVDRFKTDLKNHKIILTSISAWSHNIDFNLFMMKNVKEFCATFYDESEALESDGYAIFSKFSRYVPYSYLTNATPISKDLLQTYNNLNPIKAFTGSIEEFRNKYALVKKNTKVQNSKEVADIAKIKEDFRDYIVNFNREDLNIQVTINPFFIHAKPTKTQLKWISEGMPLLTSLFSPTTNNSETNNNNYTTEPTFKNKSVDASMKLYEVLTQITNQRGKENFGNKIIYVQHYNAKLVLKKMIEKVFGYKVFILDGQVTQKAEDQLKVANDFNNTENAIILTNIVRGSNLGSADQLITYGLPPSSNLKQFIYRAIRNMEDTEVDLIMIYYPDFQQNTLLDTYIALENESALLDRNNKLANAIKQELHKHEMINQDTSRLINKVQTATSKATTISIDKNKNTDTSSIRKDRISLNF